MEGELVLPFPCSYFDTAVIDNPWSYQDRGMNGFKGVQKYRVHPSYYTQSMEWILHSATEVRRVMKPDPRYWIWWTKDFKAEASAYMAALGVEEKQIVTWVKCNKDGSVGRGGMGRYYGRNTTEFLSYAVSGSGTHWKNGTRDNNVILAPRSTNWLGRAHSRKPDASYELIKRNSSSRRLSLYEIDPRDGFVSWGNDLPPEYLRYLQVVYGPFRALPPSPIQGKQI